MRHRGSITKKPPRRLPLFDVMMDDCMDAARLEYVIGQSETFDDLIRRLRDGGWDYCVSADPTTRKPVGRCWHITTRTSPRSHYGALWDYPGQICLPHWLPKDGMATNPHLSMTLYDVTHRDLVAGLIAVYTKAASIQSLRDVLQAHGLMMSSVLYHPLQ
jgi:hypothetical protein